MKKGITVSVIFLSLFLLGLVWAFSVEIDSTLERIAPQKPGGPKTYRSVFTGDSMKVMALGFDHAIAVAEWLKLIQYVAYCSDTGSSMDNLYAMTDAITTLDPKFEFVYEFSWTFLMTYDTRPMETKIEEGEKILQKGWRQIGDNWRLAQCLAFHLFYYQQRYAEAANLYDEAFRLRPNFALYAQLASSLRARAGDPSLALIGLKMQYGIATDDRAKRSLEYQIKRVEAEINAYELDKIIKRYVQDKGSCPSGLSDLVAANYIRKIPNDGFGGTYRLNAKKCISESTTIGRLTVYYPPNK